ncbi:Na+/H+ antiporter NhaD/arsenite permease-like protein [Rhizomicrobium palustre]|uniref:Na+/H+ antiporter NhaD/arsenite permease-like protein n=1 Tax=Rhizomicrobium palustre TaxID=189966 RepID=A0A846N0M9_9PROT|nr:sodium:proton antiporter NhaD [Rhizomicrobium palustre]NIK88727.1 Na+/H+ antiporter NhaD/arsenite permease-like protein [Rhizomicrobium palustre]
MNLAAPAVVAVFVLAYVLVFLEERLHLRKSKPVMVAAGLIWILVAIGFGLENRGDEVHEKITHVLLEYAELLLFLLSAMSFVNALVERRLFDALRARLTAANISVRGIFWLTGVGAFFLSPIADNLTTALVMGAVAISALQGHKKAIVIALVSIVVAANAGGAFSPFGDITTLMVWQKGKVEFFEFFDLFIPSLVNWLVPALVMSFFLPKDRIAATGEHVAVRRGGYVIAGLFLCTIAATVTLDHVLHLPPFLGMMTGLGVLNLYGYFLHGWESRAFATIPAEEGREPFNIFSILEKVEWDTLLFFYGIMLCVGGLSAVGYLGGLSAFLYQDLGPTTANVTVGILSAIVDNIPLTYAVLLMDPVMSHGQWLLVTLTAGTGGSLLAIGSAAGVALMGSARGVYTFAAHLKWIWAVALGYAASIAVHIWLNAALF